MVRPMVPEDDLYARLELPIDASAEAVEIAWRSLLRRHHPDVAGGDGFAANDALERTKRINVAHDWLSDPDLRARYDRERVGPRIRSRSAASGRTSTAWAAAARDMPTAPVPSRPRPRRVLETEPTVRVPAFLERVARLTTDELDRLSMAQRQPIAFAATIRRFVPPALSMELERVEIALSQLVAPGRWSDLAIREALSGVAAELVLGPFLDENLTAAFRGRARERLIRSWEASLDQPRYGPNTAEVLALRDRAAQLTPAEASRFVRASATVRATDRPWPRTLDVDEHEGLRISAALADHDLAAAPPLDGLAAATATRTRNLLGRVGHVSALRHALGPATVNAVLAPWRAAVAPPGDGDDTATADGRVGVRHGRGPRVRRRVG
jgi:hypothetical protein